MNFLTYKIYITTSDYTVSTSYFHSRYFFHFFFSCSSQDDNPDLDKPAYNPEQLEACDEAQEDLLLLHLDGSTHKTDSLGQLGATQHLFNSQVRPTGVSLVAR